MKIPAIGFDAFNLSASVADLNLTVVGARVQKIQQPVPHELILAVYGRSGAQRILLSTDPKGFRLHRTTRKRENPINAPGFCQLCRKHLDGAFILEIIQPTFDRVAELVFTTADGEKLRLVAELMGRNANLALVSGGGNVLGVMRPMPVDSPRPLRAGVVYSPPPGYRERVDPATLTGVNDPIFSELPEDPATAKQWLTETFSGIGKFAAEEIGARGREQGIAAALIGLMDAVRERRFEPHLLLEGQQPISVWAFQPLSVPTDFLYPQENIASALDSLFGELQEAAVASSERDDLRRAIDREIAFRRKEVSAAQATLKEAERAEEYERTGNNLLASLALIEKGAESARIPDLYSETGESILVALDPKRTPQENAEAFFTRARKARDAAEYASGQVIDRTHEITLLIRLSERLAVADADALAELRADLARIVGAARTTTRPDPAARPTKKFEGHKIRTFVVDGYTVLIGETAEANDYLTTRVASPSDWWFHVRSAPGAHGVLRTEGRPDRVPDAVIRRAASLVAARSGTAVKHSGIVAVDVVEKRYVRKPRGGKPGMVTYERERTLDVTPTL